MSTGRITLVVLLDAFWLAGCLRAPSPAPPDAPVPPDPLTIHSVAEVRAHAGAWQAQVLTVRGIVTSVDGALATLQSDGAGLLVDGAPGAVLGQEIITTGTLARLDENLALTDLQEWLVEREQVALPDPETLMPDTLEDSRYVRLSGGSVDAGGLWRWSGGALRLRGLDPESERRLAPGTRLDWVSGVLRRSGGGWELLPAHPRDVVPAPPRLTLCEIQGADNASDHGGQVVETSGIVTWVVEVEQGWFLQHPACDSDPSTSDALWVAAVEAAPLPEAGQQVRLRGRVAESFGRTQLTMEDGAWLAEGGGAVPAALSLAPPVGDAARAARYRESLEGMLVSLGRGQVVGPTSRFGEFALVPEGAVGARLWAGSAALGQRVMVIDDPQDPSLVAVGDRVMGLSGPLDFTFGNFKVRPTVPFNVEAEPLPPAPTLSPLGEGEWRLATLNLENLFDTHDDPATADEDSTLTPEAQAAKLDKLAATIRRPLALPTVLAVQEVETLDVLQELAAHPTLGGRYESVLVEGVDVRGIDVGLLVERSRVTVLDTASPNPCSAVGALGGGPASLCPAGQRPLFGRAPLVASLRIDGAPLTVIVVHFKSKRGGEVETQPRRNAQARFVTELVNQLRQADPGLPLAVLGDFNDGLESPTLANLTHDTPLRSLWEDVPAERRYSYVFEGVSQILDHIVVTPELETRLRTFTPLPLNADYPHAFTERLDLPFRSSDHDPLAATFGP